MHVPGRRALLAGTFAVTLIAGGLLVGDRLRGRDAVSPVPTVPAANTPTNIGCLDEAGEVHAPLADWYSNDAAGSLVLTGELSASAGLGAFSAAATKALVANVGSFITSAVRDIAPTQTACVTLRYAGFELTADTQIEVMAWRVVARTSPMWVPNEAEFTVMNGASNGNTLASRGAHAVSTLTVAPDGTTVLVIAYGAGAREMLRRDGDVATTVAGAPGLGPAPATQEQLAAIGAAVLEQVTGR